MRAIKIYKVYDLHNDDTAEERDEPLYIGTFDDIALRYFLKGLYDKADSWDDIENLEEDYLNYNIQQVIDEIEWFLYQVEEVIKWENIRS